NRRHFIRYSGFQHGIPLAGFNHRFFSSTSEAKNSSNPHVSNSSSEVVGSDWAQKFNRILESAAETLKVSGEKVEEASNQAFPYLQHWLDTYPYLRNVIVPVGGTLVGTLLAWSFLPRILRRIHKYSDQGKSVLLPAGSTWNPVPYHQGFFAALEDPARYFITFMAFLEICRMVAPTVVVSQHVSQAWSGGLVVAVVWFLNRWKTNVISRTLASKNMERGIRDKLLTVDKISSMGLFAVGSLAFAEACGVAVQSFLTVGGIGGVATAFAAKDILGNLLSGLSVQLSQPFSVGDTIRAGSVEGQVVEMGLTTTSLLTAERFPVIVPNSLFSSQVTNN
ncbi:hypothetical protein M569_16036, partial [Genlisea aurea]